MGRRVQRHGDHGRGQGLPLPRAGRGGQAAELAHDRVERVVHGDAHGDRRIDRGLLRPGPVLLLADLLVGRHSGGGHTGDNGAKRPPRSV